MRCRFYDTNVAMHHSAHHLYCSIYWLCARRAATLPIELLLRLSHRLSHHNNKNGNGIAFLACAVFFVCVCFGRLIARGQNINAILRSFDNLCHFGGAQRLRGLFCCGGLILFGASRVQPMEIGAHLVCRMLHNMRSCSCQ